MPYFASRNSHKRLRQNRAQLLPGQYLATHTQLHRAHATQNRIPAFHQVRSPRVEQNAESAIAGVSGQHVADQLIRQPASSPFVRQFGCFENLFEVAIAAQHRTRRPTGNPTRSAWPRTACCPTSCRPPCDRPSRSSAARARAIRIAASSAVSMPSNPNTRGSSATYGQQKIFISSASELIDESSSFQPRPLLGNDDLACGVHLLQALAPFRNREHGGVAFIEEVAMPAASGMRLIHRHRHAAEALYMREPSLQRESAIAQAQLVAKLRGVIGAAGGHGSPRARPFRDC